MSIASNTKLVNRLKALNVSFVKVDFSSDREREAEWTELTRTGSDALPVNFIYPPNYPNEPAIKLSANVLPGEVNRVLDRMGKIIALEN